MTLRVRQVTGQLPYYDKGVSGSSIHHHARVQLNTSRHKGHWAHWHSTATPHAWGPSSLGSASGGARLTREGGTRRGKRPARACAVQALNRIVGGVTVCLPTLRKSLAPRRLRSARGFAPLRLHGLGEHGGRDGVLLCLVK